MKTRESPQEIIDAEMNLTTAEISLQMESYNNIIDSLTRYRRKRRYSVKTIKSQKILNLHTLVKYFLSTMKKIKNQKILNFKFLPLKHTVNTSKYQKNCTVLVLSEPLHEILDKFIRF